jgi:hypothetical protein
MAFYNTPVGVNVSVEGDLTHFSPGDGFVTIKLPQYVVADQVIDAIPCHEVRLIEMNGESSI